MYSKFPVHMYRRVAVFFTVSHQRHAQIPVVTNFEHFYAQNRISASVDRRISPTVSQSSEARPLPSVA